jgi:hypothetical protein
MNDFHKRISRLPAPGYSPAHSASRITAMNSDYNSVVEQSGIFAGDGGFEITAGGHTQLDGAVIVSTGSANK